MNQAYFDQAATRVKKSDTVIHKALQLFETYGGNAGRSSYQLANETGYWIDATRKKILEFFDAPKESVCVFTGSCTDSLSMFLQGTDFKKVFVDPFSHNSVMRNITAKYTPEQSSLLSVSDLIEGKEFSEDELLVITHASNVTGKKIDCSLFDAKHLLVDASQSAGHMPISMKKEGISYLACSGHKGLGALPGIGFLILPKDTNIKPFRYGGTGKNSEFFDMPNELPLRLEPGTSNTLGIYSLYYAIEEIERIGINTIQQKERDLSKNLYSQFERLPVEIHSSLSTILSFTIGQRELSAVSDLLDQAFHISVRTGLHCAPLAHQTIGTFPYGTIRVSLNYTTTNEEIDYLISSLKQIL